MKRLLLLTLCLAISLISIAKENEFGQPVILGEPSINEMLENSKKTAARIGYCEC